MGYLHDFTFGDGCESGWNYPLLTPEQRQADAAAAASSAARATAHRANAKAQWSLTDQQYDTLINVCSGIDYAANDSMRLPRIADISGGSAATLALV